MPPGTILGKSHHQIEPDQNHAKLLVQLSAGSKEFTELNKILLDSGIEVIETTVVSDSCTLLKLSVPDMRNIALKLTERGFPVGGINALSWKP